METLATGHRFPRMGTPRDNRVLSSNGCATLRRTVRPTRPHYRYNRGMASQWAAPDRLRVRRSIALDTCLTNPFVRSWAKEPVCSTSPQRDGPPSPTFGRLPAPASSFRTPQWRLNSDWGPGIFGPQTGLVDGPGRFKAPPNLLETPEPMERERPSEVPLRSEFNEHVPPDRSIPSSERASNRLRPTCDIAKLSRTKNRGGPREHSTVLHATS